MSAFNAGDETFDLPKFDARIADLDDRVGAATGFGNRCKAQYDFLKAVLPDEYLAKRLDGKTFSTIDRIELNVIYAEVSRAYRAPLDAVQSQQLDDQMANYGRAFEVIDSLSKMGDRQAFKNLR